MQIRIFFSANWNCQDCPLGLADSWWKNNNVQKQWIDRKFFQMWQYIQFSSRFASFSKSIEIINVGACKKYVEDFFFKLDSKHQEKKTKNWSAICKKLNGDTSNGCNGIWSKHKYLLKLIWICLVMNERGNDKREKKHLPKLYNSLMIHNSVSNEQDISFYFGKKINLFFSYGISKLYFIIADWSFKDVFSYYRSALVSSDLVNIYV